MDLFSLIYLWVCLFKPVNKLQHACFLTKSGWCLHFQLRFPQSLKQSPQAPHLYDVVSSWFKIFVRMTKLKREGANLEPFIESKDKLKKKKEKRKNQKLIWILVLVLSQKRKLKNPKVESKRKCLRTSYTNRTQCDKENASEKS